MTPHLVQVKEKAERDRADRERVEKEKSERRRKEREERAAAAKEAQLKADQLKRDKIAKERLAHLQQGLFPVLQLCRYIAEAHDSALYLRLQYVNLYSLCKCLLIAVISNIMLTASLLFVLM